MIINTLMEELARETVLYAMKQEPTNDFFENQTPDSIFNIVYNNLCNQNGVLGA